ncbi:MAG: cytochrome c biogenesis protein CcsA [Muribaculaceae bacterium]|nr:cytochrome c biogenesis protein CcsA [Muribaculaceae bacterium]
MIPFVILALIAGALAAVSLIPDGSEFYTSLPMVTLWAALFVTSSIVIVKKRLWRNWRSFILHLSFLVIICGAGITHFTGTNTTLHLRIGESARTDGPEVTLVDFRTEYYDGTSAPRDFVSRLSSNGRLYEVSMNNVADIDGYRFFQTACDSDGGGSTFTLSHDPVGTAVTYAGYILLLVAMIACSVGHRKAVVLLAVFLWQGADAAPKAIPEDIADAMSSLAVYHNDRIAPLSTLASDFTKKLTGSSSYDGLTPEQVLTGWLFYYDDWKAEPCIYIKDPATRAEFGGRKMVSLTDFFTPEGYRFEDSSHPEANEKFSIASSAAAGSMWKLFPIRSEKGATSWYSPVEPLPDNTDVADWHIARHSLSLLAQLAQEQDWDGMRDAIGKIAAWQKKQAGETVPTRFERQCEKWYMTSGSRPEIPGLMIVCGILMLVFRLRRAAFIISAVSLLLVSSLMAANWVASGHLPLSNGHETMQLMSFCTLLFTLILSRKNESINAMGLIVAGLALMVAWMGQRTPQVTQLMPVLNSPLLSLHVLTVMIAYSLLAIMALSGLMWLCGRKDMLHTARTLLRPAVFMLTAGIFIGAVWANVSWGRYWGWDPKEVWALITMIIYSFPLHPSILPSFRNDKIFAFYCVLSFASVLMTYFGVNYILGGLHSYS